LNLGVISSSVTCPTILHFALKAIPMVYIPIETVMAIRAGAPLDHMCHVRNIFLTVSIGLTQNLIGVFTHIQIEFGQDLDKSAL
jgi:hypothetical protein